MTLKLYEIADSIERVLLDGTDTETGEISEEAVGALDKLEMQLSDKALAVARYVMGEQAEAEAVKVQADRLAKRSTVHRNRAARLKKYLEGCLEPGTKLRDDVVEITWRKSARVEIIDESQIPEDCFRIKREVSKTAIKAAITDGEIIRGAELVTRRNMVLR
jgi:hypothetical protein